MDNFIRPQRAYFGVAAAILAAMRAIDHSWG